jgi:hypothetical protein
LANCQAQPLQKVFSIFADPPVFGSRDHNGGVSTGEEMHENDRFGNAKRRIGF